VLDHHAGAPVRIDHGRAARLDRAGDRRSDRAVDWHAPRALSTVHPVALDHVVVSVRTSAGMIGQPMLVHGGHLDPHPPKRLFISLDSST